MLYLQICNFKFYPNNFYAKIFLYEENNFIASFNNFYDAVKTRLLAEQKYFGEYSSQKDLYEQYGLYDESERRKLKIWQEKQEKN